MYIDAAADNIRVSRPWARPTADLVNGLAAYPTALIGDVRRRMGLMSSEIRCLTPGLRLAGSILPIQIWEGDNLAIHRGLDEAQPGDVLVVAGNSVTGRSVFGGILAEICLAHGVKGVIVDGAVRDLEETARLGLPVFARAVSPAGPSKNGPGTVGAPVACGNMVCNPGDAVIGDDDGIIVVPADEVEETLALLPAQQQAETAILNRLAAERKQS
ncbi:regulator of RNase E activity RraA [Spinactinospora alkalitolerans]|uniref:Putative 4-hydroxy-4-methyl-2-oxoglutarate aldolase n=1 Tax=Spinactinospora alkalitolerans TaxID=687207 RepID=A0A852TVM7_9ACTN|nr:RraA family protein [Spinactinospora alkalitolerans]NYE47988.1 regulator of RNase E activity RraA [Spinactinospora alkalitolerans]